MTYYYHHTALTRGYVRVGQEIREEYNGKFGTSYTVKRHNNSSARYCYIDYYVSEV